jgi:hypothetical protein
MLRFCLDTSFLRYVLSSCLSQDVTKGRSWHLAAAAVVVVGAGEDPVVLVVAAVAADLVVEDQVAVVLEDIDLGEDLVVEEGNRLDLGEDIYLVHRIRTEQGAAVDQEQIPAVVEVDKLDHFLVALVDHPVDEVGHLVAPGEALVVQVGLDIDQGILLEGIPGDFRGSQGTGVLLLVEDQAFADHTDLTWSIQLPAATHLFQRSLQEHLLLGREDLSKETKIRCF